MKDTNIIRNIIRNELIKNNLMESDNYPLGAGDDPSAPWNQSSSPEISKIRINYETQQFEVVADNGNEFQVDFIDFLENYWKSHKGSFEQHDTMFGQDDTTADVNTIKHLKEQGTDFSAYLSDILEDQLNGYEDEGPDPDDAYDRSREDGF